MTDKLGEYINERILVLNRERYNYDPWYHAVVHLVGRCVWAFGRFCDRYAP